MQNEISEQIALASKVIPPVGHECVIWKNKLTKTSRKVSFGFNFQPIGKISVGQTFEESWGGERQLQAVCECVAVIRR